MPYVTSGLCTARGTGHHWTDHEHALFDGMDLVCANGQVLVEPDFVYVWTFNHRFSSFAAQWGWKPGDPFPGEWVSAPLGGSHQGWMGRQSGYVQGDRLFIVQVEGPVARSANPTTYCSFLRGRLIHEIDLAPLSDPKILEPMKDTHWAAAYPKVTVRKLKPLIDPDRLVTLTNIRREAAPLLAELDLLKQRQDNYHQLRGLKPWDNTTYPEYKRLQRQLNQYRRLARQADYLAPPLGADPSVFPPGPLRTFMERGS